MADVLWRLIWIALGLIFLTKCCPADGVEVGLAMDSQKQEMPTDRSGLSLWTLAYAVDFVHAFVASISVIIVSELGDKTFFIAALMAMRHSRLVVFSGAIAALFIMTVLSVVLGFATTVIPRTYTYYASTVLFAVFGIKMMKEAWGMSPDEGQEELEQVSAELKKKDEQVGLLLWCNGRISDITTLGIQGKIFQISGLLLGINIRGKMFKNRCATESNEEITNLTSSYNQELHELSVSCLIPDSEFLWAILP